MFSRHLYSVNTSHSSSTQDSSIVYPQHNLPINAYFTFEYVYNSLVDLRGKTSIGPDGLSGDFLFNLLDVIAGLLWILFRKSFDEGIFPSLFKLCSITPILKLGDASKLKITGQLLLLHI